MKRWFIASLALAALVVSTPAGAVSTGSKAPNFTLTDTTIRAVAGSKQ